MKRPPFVIPLLIACFFTLFASALCPQLKLLTLSPLLPFLYYRFSFVGSLWISSLCGLSLDLLCSDLHLGIYALAYCGTTLLLYTHKRHFFEDKPLAVCLFTGLISLTNTLVLWLLIPLCGHPFALSKGLLLTDLVLMPLADSLYAFVCFSCPLMFYFHIKRVGWQAFYNSLLCALRLRKTLPKSPE